ncbi:MAG: transposase [Alphaproteobacteria bacterium]|nr:transposase [Alphaproteobacteria bacterium]
MAQSPAQISDRQAQEDYLREVARSLTSAAHGEAKTILGEVTARLNISKQTLYRRLESLGWDSGRKTRCDAGKSAVTREVALQLAAMLNASTSGTGKQRIPGGTAAEIYKAQHHAETGELLAPQVSNSTYLRRLRELGLSPNHLKIPSPQVEMRSLHPNHVWQIDASVCAQFYMEDKGLQTIDGRKYYKNKPENDTKIQSRRVIRYVVTDHYSGAFYVHYCIGSETAENLINAFLGATQKRRASDPMHGVPLILMLDPGAANTSGIFKVLMKRLSVEMLVHLPGAARVNGQVEKTHDIIERQFEGRLIFGKPLNLLELQTAADQWADGFQATKTHRRHHKTRHAAWIEIRQEQLRLAPPVETCIALAHTMPTEVTVSGRMEISFAPKGFGSQKYNVNGIEGVAPKSKLMVCVNPYHAPAVNVILTDIHGVESQIMLEPIKYTSGGFREDSAVIAQQVRVAKTVEPDQNRDAVRLVAWNGATTEQEEAKERNSRAPAMGGGIDAFADQRAVPLRDYIMKRGTDLKPNIPEVEVPPLNLASAALRLRDIIGDSWGSEQYQWLEQNYPDGVPVGEIDSIVAELAVSQPQPSHLRLVAN